MKGKKRIHMKSIVFMRLMGRQAVLVLLKLFIIGIENLPL